MEDVNIRAISTDEFNRDMYGDMEGIWPNHLNFDISYEEVQKSVDEGTAVGVFDNNALVGYFIDKFGIDGDRKYIAPGSKIGFDDNHQNCGLGTKTFEYKKKLCREKGIDEVRTYVNLFRKKSKKRLSYFLGLGGKITEMEDYKNNDEMLSCAFFQIPQDGNFASQNPFEDIETDYDKLSRKEMETNSSTFELKNIENEIFENLENKKDFFRIKISDDIKDEEMGNFIFKTIYGLGVGITGHEKTEDGEFLIAKSWEYQQKEKITSKVQYIKYDMFECIDDPNMQKLMKKINAKRRYFGYEIIPKKLREGRIEEAIPEEFKNIRYATEKRLEMFNEASDFYNKNLQSINGVAAIVDGKLRVAPIQFIYDYTKATVEEVGEQITAGFIFAQQTSKKIFKQYPNRLFEFEFIVDKDNPEKFKIQDGLYIEIPHMSINYINYDVERGIEMSIPEWMESHQNKNNITSTNRIKIGEENIGFVGGRPIDEAYPELDGESLFLG